MSTNTVQDGFRMTWTNVSGSAVAANQIVKAGSMLFVAAAAIANGAVGVLISGCVVTAPKVSAAVFVQGEKLLWDVSAVGFDDALATPAAGDVSNAAIAWKAGANAETTCEVLLLRAAGTVT